MIQRHAAIVKTSSVSGVLQRKMKQAGMGELSYDHSMHFGALETRPTTHFCSLEGG